MRISLKHSLRESHSLGEKLNFSDDMSVDSSYYRPLSRQGQLISGIYETEHGLSACKERKSTSFSE